MVEHSIYHWILSVNASNFLRIHTHFLERGVTLDVCTANASRIFNYTVDVQIPELLYRLKVWGFVRYATVTGTIQILWSSARVQWQLHDSVARLLTNKWEIIKIIYCFNIEHEKIWNYNMRHRKTEEDNTFFCLELRLPIKTHNKWIDEELLWLLRIAWTWLLKLYLFLLTVSTFNVFKSFAREILKFKMNDIIQCALVYLQSLNGFLFFLW